MGKREILHALRERVNGGAGAAPQRMSVAVEAVKRSVALTGNTALHRLRLLKAVSRLSTGSRAPRGGLSQFSLFFYINFRISSRSSK